MTIKSIPNRPAISDLLIKASANIGFRSRLLISPRDAVQEMNLSPEDAALLTDIQAPNLREFAQQIKIKLLVNHL